MKKNSVWTIVCFVLVLALLAGAFGWMVPEIAVAQTKKAQQEEPIVWKWQSAWALSGGAAMVMRKALDVIEKQSDGRIRFDYYSPGQLVAEKDYFPALAAGTVDIVISNFWMHTHIEPQFNAMKLPFSFGSGYEGHEAMHFFGAYDVMKELTAQHGVYLLASNGGGPLAFISRKPLRKVEDFKGILANAFSKSDINIFNSLGAKTASVPTSELYPAFQRGVIDLTGNPPYIIKTYKLAEVAKYCILPSITSFTNEVFASMKSWNALPDDLKKLLEEGLYKYLSCHYTFFVAQANIEGLKFLEEKGGEVIRLPDSEVVKLKELTKGVWDEVASLGPHAKRVVEIWKRNHENWSKTR